MTGARLGEVYRVELTYSLRRPLFWVLIVMIGFLAFKIAGGEASISSGNARVGGTRAWITSEFAIAQLLILMVSLIYAFFVSVGAGMSVIRDGDLNVGELLHSTRLSPAEYVWGKYFAQLASFLWVLAVHLSLMMLFNHALPHAENVKSIGPFVLMNYLKPALLFALPMLIFSVGTSFAIGGLTRKPVLVFILPVAVLMFGAVFLWKWSPAWIPNSLNNALMFVDLSGLRWIEETWLTVDKGVDFYNQHAVGLDALILSQRALCVVLGLAAVWFYQLRFTRLLRGAAAPRPGRAKIAPAPAAAVALDPAPVAALGMRSGAPGFWSAVLETAGVVFAFNTINRIADARRVRLEYRFLRELKPIRGWVERRLASLTGLAYDLSYKHQPRRSPAELLDRLGVLFERLGAPAVPDVFNWLSRSPVVLEGVLEMIEVNLTNARVHFDLLKEAAAIGVASRAMPGSGLSGAVDQCLSGGLLPDSNTLRAWAAPSGVAPDAGLVSACRRYAWQVANAPYTISDEQIREISALGLSDAELLDLTLATALFSALAIIEPISAAVVPSPIAVG
jgi:hypothetical protein